MRALLLLVFLGAAFVLNWGLSRMMAFGTPDQPAQAFRVAKILALIPSLMLLVGLWADSHPSLVVGMIGGICLCDAVGAWLNVLLQGAGGVSSQRWR